MIKIGMTLWQRCANANILPKYGTLAKVSEYKALRGKLVECLSQTQLEAYKVSKSKNGVWSVDETMASTGTMVSLTNEELIYFKSFIAELDKAGSVDIELCTLYNTILSTSLEEVG